MRDGPARGGTRGGKDQFSWDAVKGDKDREYYLGHSVKASVGRWQKGKDLLWYTREKDGDGGGVNAEIAAIKAAEEQAMAEALGLKPKTEPAHRGARLEQHELDELLRRGRTAEDVDESERDAARVRGVGIAGDARGVGGATREVMAGTGLDSNPRAERPGRTRYRDDERGTKRSRDRDGGGDGAGSSRDERKAAKKAAKRERKAAKKMVKRAKKEAKRAKKEAKRRARRDSDSGSDSGSDSDSDSSTRS